MRWAILASVIALAPGMAAAQETGATLFKRCSFCHDVGPDARNKAGPQLNGLDGRKAGTAAGYSYSAANKSAGFTWSEASFIAYIKDPKAKIPGTKKVFAGVPSEDDARALWDYLSQFGADGQSKPK